jgi:hypothetical protein
MIILLRICKKNILQWHIDFFKLKPTWDPPERSKVWQTKTVEIQISHNFYYRFYNVELCKAATTNGLCGS